MAPPKHTRPGSFKQGPLDKNHYYGSLSPHAESLTLPSSNWSKQHRKNELAECPEFFRCNIYTNVHYFFGQFRVVTILLNKKNCTLSPRTFFTMGPCQKYLDLHLRHPADVLGGLQAHPHENAVVEPANNPLVRAGLEMVVTRESVLLEKTDCVCRCVNQQRVQDATACPLLDVLDQTSDQQRVRVYAQSFISTPPQKTHENIPPPKRGPNGIFSLKFCGEKIKVRLPIPTPMVLAQRKTTTPKPNCWFISNVTNPITVRSFTCM